MEQIIEVMLGTSARIGEVLAIRKCDVDVTSSPATVRLCGTIVSPAGKPTPTVAPEDDDVDQDRLRAVVSPPTCCAHDS